MEETETNPNIEIEEKENTEANNIQPQNENPNEEPKDQITSPIENEELEKNQKSMGGEEEKELKCKILEKKYKKF